MLLLLLWSLCLVIGQSAVHDLVVVITRAAVCVPPVRWCQRMGGIHKAQGEGDAAQTSKTLFWQTSGWEVVTKRDDLSSLHYPLQSNSFHTGFLAAPCSCSDHMILCFGRSFLQEQAATHGPLDRLPGSLRLLLIAEMTMWANASQALPYILGICISEGGTCRFKPPAWWLKLSGIAGLFLHFSHTSRI